MVNSVTFQDGNGNPPGIKLSEVLGQANAVT